MLILYVILIMMFKNRIIIKNDNDIDFFPLLALNVIDTFILGFPIFLMIFISFCLYIYLYQSLCFASLSKARQPLAF